ncbi:MAG: class I SAM-dependent methyltransferase [Acidimicrobiales bacterium]|jgi:SAM-dependent methyltransferase
MSDDRTLPAEVLERLRCPTCGKEVSALAAGAGVECGSGHRFDRRNGVLDVSRPASPRGSTERTFASFGYEWNAFDDVREEDESFATVYFRDIDLEGLQGKVGLDAGCGKGRYTRFLARHLKVEVALDGSSAAEAAARNLADIEGATVVRSDLRDAPFAPESFDFISSLGVLHHLDDPFAGFESLVGLLAPGGQILLYLYSRPQDRGLRSMALSCAAALRKITTRMPHPALKAVSTPIAAFLWWTFVQPGAWGDEHGFASLSGLPMDAYRGKPFRSLVLDTFDRLSAPVENRYVWSDLQPWFERTGLVVDAARDETGWFVLAHRP